MDIWLRAERHAGDHAYDAAGSRQCRLCACAALAVAVADGTTDDEILDFFGSSEHITPPDLRGYEMALLAVHGESPRRRDEPTQYAREMIPKVRAEARSLQRRKWRKVTKSAMARAVGVHRDTINDWIKRGWLEWPPAD